MQKAQRDEQSLKKVASNGRCMEMCRQRGFFLNGSALDVTVISFGWETMRRIVLQLWISQVAVLRLSVLQDSCEPTLREPACTLGLFLCV